MTRSNCFLLAAVAVIVVFLVLRPTSHAQGGDVEAALRDHALVIDVRTTGEYAAGHLPGVTNVPINRLAKEIVALAPDHDRPIALHCASGGRSGSGCEMLKKMGYTRVYNLGSYGRAEKMLRAIHGD